MAELSNIIYFTSPDDFRRWLEANHAQAQELWVGYYRKDSGKVGMTWKESVDAALSFGWIDSVRKSVDAESYANRFTPRKPGSNWSAVNIKRIEELIAQGLVHPAGLKAFEQRTEAKSAVYAYEQREHPTLDEAAEQQFRANPLAWDFFQSRAPSYQKAALWWVISAKSEATRAKRLATLIDDSANGRTIAPLTRKPKST